MPRVPVMPRQRAAGPQGCAGILQELGVRTLRILLYNFAQPEQGKWGGGVSVYQANLARALKAAGHDVILMSSGTRHSVRRRPPRLLTAQDEFERAEVTDSPVIAPAIYTFFRLQSYTKSRGLDDIPAAIKDRFGDIDVFHFQNIEGLTQSFFRVLRQAYPQAKLIMSAHNYNIVCPEVHLWFQGDAVCGDYRGGRSCTECRPFARPHRFDRESLMLQNLMVRFGLGESSVVFRSARGAARLGRGAYQRLGRWRRRPAPAPGHGSDLARVPFEQFRLANIGLCSEVFDHVLAVSDRTRHVLAQRGVPAGNLAVSYIGTRHKATYLKARKVTAAPDGLHLGYLGYMRKDKGFYFLLDGLEAMDADAARTISVTVAARISDPAAAARLHALQGKFKSVALHDGFTHATLDAVLKGVSLGIVPVLWEDNLPQVAIELVSRGIPILTSDRGGAREIARNDAFCFQAGSVAAFHERIAAIRDGRTPLSDFWTSEPALFSMEEHVQDLMRYYSSGAGVLQPSEPSRQRAS